VSGDIVELLHLLVGLLHTLKETPDRGAAALLSCKDWADVIRRLATLLNSFNADEMRRVCMEALEQLASIAPAEVIPVLTSLLLHYHTAFQDNHASLPQGPHFPRSMKALAGLKTIIRPTRPMVQMAIPHHKLDAHKVQTLLFTHECGSCFVQIKVFFFLFSIFFKFISFFCTYAPKKIKNPGGHVGGVSDPTKGFRGTSSLHSYVIERYENELNAP